MIAQRLKMARTATGLSLRELQEKIGNLVTAQMIGRYERDEAMPGSAALIALADALDVSENYLLDQSELRLEAVEFRKNRITNRKEEASVEATVLDAVERYLTIEELVARRAQPGRPLPARRFQCAAWTRPRPPQRGCARSGIWVSIPFRISLNFSKSAGSR